MSASREKNKRKEQTCSEMIEEIMDQAKKLLKEA